MGVWDTYIERTGQRGTMREAIIADSKVMISTMIADSPSSHLVTINGEEQLVSITHGQYLNQKRICSMPDEHLIHGGLVAFADNMWLITEVDADNEIYERGKMIQCNYVLKWIGRDGKLKEKWCIVEDGTKYLIGEYAEDIMAIGDARLALTIGKDDDTIELSRGARFLIDDPDSDVALAYQITKPNKLYNIYNGQGVFKFILNEVQSTDEDNVALRIADYTNWDPPIARDGDHADSTATVDQIVAVAQARAEMTPNDNKEVWL